MKDDTLILIFGVALLVILIVLYITGRQKKKSREKVDTQSYIPVREIRDGIIITEDERYISYLEILPINRETKESEEKRSMDLKYKRLIDIAPEHWQIKCTTRTAQIDFYIDSFKKALKDEPSLETQDMIDEHIKFAKGEGTQNSIEKHYYFIYEYTTKEDRIGKLTEEEIVEKIKRNNEKLANAFNSVGNKVLMKSDTPDYDTAEFLYEYFNRRHPEHQTMDNRLDRLERDYGLAYSSEGLSDLPLLDMRDVLAPRSIDNSNPEYLIVNGIYQAHFYVQANGYPAVMEPTGWLYQLINFGLGFDTDIFYDRKDRMDTLKSLRAKGKWLNAKAADISSSALNKDKVDAAAIALDQMKSALTNGENPYDMAVVMTVYANTRKVLYDKIDALKDAAVMLGIGISSCSQFQEEAYISTMPFAKLTKKMRALTKHNITSSCIVAAYPFSSMTLNDTDGIIYGTSTATDSLIIYNNFDTKKYQNANITILGQTGSGKTFALLTLTERMRMLGTQVFIFSPEKQDEFRPVAEALGGEFIDIAPSSKTKRINPFDIWPIESIDDTLLYGKDSEEKSWLTDKIENLSIWYEFLYPEAGIAEKARMKSVTERMYKKKGITQENDSIYRDRVNRVKKAMPTYSDLYAEIKQEVGNGKLSDDWLTIIEQFVKGPLKNLNGQTTADLDNKYIVFGFEHLKGDLMAPLMFIVLEYVWGVARANKTQKKLICIDEGWMLLDERKPQVADFVVNLFKTIRGYGGGALFATQSIDDLYSAGEKNGNKILGSSFSNILLKMKDSDIDHIKQQLHLSDEDIDRLIHFENRGDALLCAGRNHIPMHIGASAKEIDLFTTDSKALKEKAERLRKEAAYE